MTTLLDAARQALDYIVATNKSSQFMLVPESNLNKTVAALRTAIEEAEKAEPPEWLRSMCRYISDTLESGTPNERFMARTIMHILPLDQLTTLYTHPPTDESAALRELLRLCRAERDELAAKLYARQPLTNGQIDAASAHKIKLSSPPWRVGWKEGL